MDMFYRQLSTYDNNKNEIYGICDMEAKLNLTN